MPPKLERTPSAKINVEVTVSNIKVNKGAPVHIMGLFLGGEGTFKCHLSDPDGNLTRSVLSSFFIFDEDKKDIKFQFLAKNFDMFEISFVTHEALPPSITMEDIARFGQRRSSAIIARCVAEYILKILDKTKSVEINGMVLGKVDPVKINRMKSGMIDKPFDMRLVIGSDEVCDLGAISTNENGDPLAHLTTGNIFSNEFPENSIHIILHQGALKEIADIEYTLATMLKIPCSRYMPRDMPVSDDLIMKQPEALDNTEDRDNAEELVSSDVIYYENIGLFGTGLRRRHKNTLMAYQTSEIKFDR